jgi:hypothetical protein
VLIPFEIDTEALDTSSAYAISPEIKIRHDELLRAWLKYGVLTYNGKNFNDSKFFQTIENLPISIRKIWEEAIKNYPRIKSTSTNWNGEINKDILNKISEKPSVIIVEETKAVIDFEVSVDEYSKVDEKKQFEIVKFPYTSGSIFFKKSEEKSLSHFKKSELFEVIWQERFHWLAASENIKNIAIVDRYVMQNHLNWDPHQGKSGLHRFLLFLDKSASSNKNIKLFSGWGSSPHDLTKKNQNESDFLESLTMILKKLPNKKILNVTLHLLHDKDIGDESHSRHIRFGDFHVWELDKGLSCFDGNTCCKQKLAATFKYGRTVTKEFIEKELELELNKGKSHKTYTINLSNY